MIKLVLVNVLVFGLFYSVIELSYSAYRYFLTDTSPDSFAVFEHPGETIRFDPIRGYLLTATPSRVARVNHGKLEYAGSFRGNAQGFASRHDFSIRRSAAIERRIAVFGDSFTAETMEPFNSLNWPDRVEERGRGLGDDKRPLVMLNFAVDGGGLANWASVLSNIVVKDGYELDGIVFAVAWDDLDRKFAMFDQLDAQRFAHARASTWDVDSQPRTRSEARVLLENDSNLADRYILSSAGFDAFLMGRWRPRRWRFQISARLARLIATLTKPKPKEAAVAFEPGQIALIKEIRQLASERSWPIYVAYIPDREELLDPTSRTDVEKSRFEKAKKFSEMLGALFLDGREAFRGLTSEQIKSDWFPIDGHWNQGGSDRFAYFVGAQLPRLLAAREGQRASRLEVRRNVEGAAGGGRNR